MDRPFDDFNDSNQSTEKSLNDVLVALSKLETFTKTMDIDELDGYLADLIRADHAVTTHQPPLSDPNNNAIPSTINHLTHSEVQTSEQEQMRLFLRTPQFLPSFESFQRSVKQATMEGFAPKDLMNIPAVSKSSDGQHNRSDCSLISKLRSSQRLKDKDLLVNINQRQFSGGSRQVKNKLTGQVEMSRPGTLLPNTSTYQGYQSNKLQNRPDTSPQENTPSSLFLNQPQKTSFLPTIISRNQTSTQGVSLSSSINQTKLRRCSQYEHLSSKGNLPNTTNPSSTSSVHHDLNRPGTPWIGSMPQNYQSKQMVPCNYQENTKLYRNYPNQPHKVSAHSSSTTNLVNALRGNSTHTFSQQNSASVNNMKSPKSSNQAKTYFYKKPYSQAERVTDGSKEVELRKRLAAPNIYSTQGSSKIQYASTKITISNSTATLSNKSLPRGYTHMTATSNSSSEHKTMANYIDLTDGNVQNNTGFYKQQQTQQSNDLVIKTEKLEVDLIPTPIAPAPKNKQNGFESTNNYRAQNSTYNDKRLGYGRSHQIKAEMICSNDNIQCTSNQSNFQNAVNITSLPQNQDTEFTESEINNTKAAKNQFFGQQHMHYNRLVQNTTHKKYSNYAYQNNNFGYGANEAENHNDTYQNCAGQNNASGYVPNGTSWSYFRDESSAYDQNQSNPNSSRWNPNISGWYQQNNDFMDNTSSGFQQANQIVTTNNTSYPIHQENNLHMNIYNFNSQQGYQQQEAWNGQAQPTPEHGTNSVVQNHRVESSMLILNRDILDLDQYQKQQRDLLIKIGLTRAIYNDQNSTEEEKHRRMADLLDSVLATPDGTNIVRDIIEEQCRRVGYDMNKILEQGMGKKQE